MKIIFNNDLGTISIVYPHKSFTGTATELAKKTVPKDIEWFVVEDDFVIPSDRTLRNAWEYNSIDKKIKINQTKANEIIKKQKEDSLIQAKIRELAISELKKEGKIS